MQPPGTFTYTWTHTRLESIQDQFRYLLVYAGFLDLADKIDVGLDQKVVSALGMHGFDSTNRKVIEVELQVNWLRYGELTLTAPNIPGGLPGWLDKQAPEVRVAGSRFAKIVASQGLQIGLTLTFVDHVENDPATRAYWEAYYSRYDPPREWKNGGYEEKWENFLDLGELGVNMRRARRDD